MIRASVLLAFLLSGAFSDARGSAQKPGAAETSGFDQLLASAVKARDDNRNDEAIRLFRLALTQKPDSEEGLWYLGTALYETEHFAEARDVLRRFMTLRPDAGPGWALLGMSEFQSRGYRRALGHLQRAIAQGMGDREDLAQTVYYHVVILLNRFEHYDDSMDLLQKMLASGRPDPGLREPAGLAGLRLPYLPTEIPADQRDLVLLAGKAVMAMHMHRSEEADSEFKRLVEIYPKEPGVHFLRGGYLAQLHPKEAVPEFERELEISPSHVVARVRLAQQFIIDGDFDHALALSHQAIQLDPKRASAHMMAGEALMAKGDPVNGIRELESARDADRSIARVHWDLLRAYTAAGRKDDAGREKKEIEMLFHGDPSQQPPSIGESAHDSLSPK